MAKRESFVLNFRFMGNAQSGQAIRPTGANQARDARGRFTSLDNFARVMVQDVALNTATRTYNLAKQNLEANIKTEVAREISRMAKMIGKFVVQPGNARGPKGLVTSAQQTISAQARSLWGNKNVLYYDVGSSDARWKQRSKSYMGWKKKNNYPEDWWSMKGELRKALSQEALYQELGPVSVTFTKGGNEPTGGNIKQTTSGRSGKVSATYQIGQVSVAVFGRITPAMLPSIMDTFSGGVGEVTPGSGPYLPSLFKDEDVKNKLLHGSADTYRPVIEPFVSYYLTRAIPNAIFNRTEKLISDAARVGDRRSN